MTLTPITIDTALYPPQFHTLLADAEAVFDSSCSPQARVIFIKNGAGFFLKSAPKGTLARQNTMTRYFHSIGLTAKAVSYFSDQERDWLLTEQVAGDDCTTQKYMQQPERLVDTLAEQLLRLHATDYRACPVQNHTELYLATAKHNKETGTYNKDHFPDSFGYTSPDEAWAVVQAHGHLLQCDTLLHGDYCLPNVILENWRFSGFIDLDGGGVGDRHVDLFWAIWSLEFNFGTNKYRDRFLDAYGRGKVNEDMLRVVAAVEVFG